jgi:hypothetical protein
MIKKGPSRAFIPASKPRYPMGIGKWAKKLKAGFRIGDLIIGKPGYIIHPHKHLINSFVAKFSSSVALLSHRWRTLSYGNLILNFISNFNDLAPLPLLASDLTRLNMAFFFWISLSTQSLNQGLGTILFCTGLYRSFKSIQLLQK